MVWRSTRSAAANSRASSISGMRRIQEGNEFMALTMPANVRSYRNPFRLNGPGADPGVAVSPLSDSECGRAAIRVERKKEVVSALDHGGRHRLRDGVVGIDERVVRLESVEMKPNWTNFRRRRRQTGNGRNRIRRRLRQAGSPLRGAAPRNRAGVSVLRPSPGRSGAHRLRGTRP
jgi:hypothetical protein